MGRLDTMFYEIVSDKEMAETFKYNPEDYKTIDKGERSTNKYVKALATMLKAFHKKVEDSAMTMRIKRQYGRVVIKEADMDTLYRKLVNDLK